MTETASERSEVAVVLEALIATSVSRSEKRSLVALQKSVGSNVTWGDPSLQGDSQAHGLLSMAWKLSEHSTLLERFVEARRDASLSTREWKRIWFRPIAGAVTLLAGVSLLAVAIEFMGTLAAMTKMKSLVDEPLPDFYLIMGKRPADNGLLSLIDRLRGVLRSLFIGVVPGLFMLFAGSIAFNYWIAGAKAVDVMLYRLPILGNKRMRADAARLLSGISMLMSAGEPLSKALKRCGQSMSPFPRYLSEKISTAVDQGVPWGQAIANERLFPDWMIAWFSIDASEGSLPIRFKTAAELIEGESRWGAGLDSRFLTIVTLWSIGILILWFYTISLWAVGNSIWMISGGGSLISQLST